MPARIIRGRRRDDDAVIGPPNLCAGSVGALYTTAADAHGGRGVSSRRDPRHARDWIPDRQGRAMHETAGGEVA